MADVAMTGEAGAKRTFQSIFGDQEKRHDQVLHLEIEHSDDSSSIAADSGAAALTMDDDDDEAMWNDDSPLDVNVTALDNNDLSGLQFAQRKSMEEWMDDDEEEENWKEALQDRVIQLELAFQNNDDSAAAQSRRQFEQQQMHQLPDHDMQRADFSQSLPLSARFNVPDAGMDRPQRHSRYKMHRSSSTNAFVTSDNSVASSRQSHLWNFQRKVAGEVTAPSVNQNSRLHSTSIDFVARNIQTVEHHRKRSGSLSGSATRTDSPRHSLSRPNLLYNSRSSPSQSNSSSLYGTRAATPADVTSSISSSTAVFNLSDTEAIRRFVLDDVKTMSMERLVSDAQRLHFLEDFYQTWQGSRLKPSVTTSSAVTTTSPTSSSSAISTS